MCCSGRPTGGAADHLDTGIRDRVGLRRSWFYSLDSIAAARIFAGADQRYRRHVDSWSFDALTPTSFLTRTATVYPERIAIIDGDRRFTYGEMQERCATLAGSLYALAGGRPVAVLAPNSHVLLEAHYAVPWSGSPLVALNTRLTTADLVHILRHCDASVLLFDSAYAETARTGFAEVPGLELVRGGRPDGLLRRPGRGGAVPEDARRRRAQPALHQLHQRDDGKAQGRDVPPPRGLSAGSGHGGARASSDPTTRICGRLPMFHCNGWCFTWATVAAAATNVCLRRVDPADMWRLIDHEDVSVLCGAPTVLSMLGYAPEAHRRDGRPCGS